MATKHNLKLPIVAMKKEFWKLVNTPIKKVGNVNLQREINKLFKGK